MIRTNSANRYGIRTKARNAAAITGIVLLLLSFGACPLPASDNPSPDTGGNNPIGETTGSPDGDAGNPILGELSMGMKEGTFWEYAWSFAAVSFSQGYGSSGISETGRYTIALGSESIIDGIAMFAVVRTGTSTDSTSYEYAPRWNWLGCEGGKLYGSVDGISAEAICDAEAETWKGGGFFTDLSRNEANTFVIYLLDNEFITAETYGISLSSSQGAGFYIGSTYISPSDKQYSTSIAECYMSGIGPVGYTYYLSSSNNGGGFYSSGTIKREIGLIDTNLASDNGFVPRKPAWTPKAPMLHPRTAFATGVIDGKIYAAGGGSETLEMYDPETDSWTELASPPFPISSGTAYNKKLYCITSLDSTIVDNAICIFDPAEDAWSTVLLLADMNSFNVQAVPTDSGIYFFNGIGSRYNDVWLYKPALNDWDNVAMSNEKYLLRAGAASDGSYLYAAGGYRNSEGFLTDIRRLQISTGEWTNFGRMSAGKYDSGVAVLGGYLYIAGGYSTAGTLRTFERLPLGQGDPELLPGIPTARKNPAVAVMNGKIFIIGGSNGNNESLSAVEEFDPALIRH